MKKNISKILFSSHSDLFFYLPILYTIIFSFNDSRSLTVFKGFSLQWYERMFNDRNMMQAI